MNYFLARIHQLMKKMKLYSLIVEEPGFKNVRNKHLGMSPFYQNFQLFYPLVHSIGSMKPDIALNLSLAKIPVTVCLTRYPSFS